MKDRKITVRLPKDLYDSLERESEAMDEDVSSVVRDSLRQKFDNGPKIEEIIYERKRSGKEYGEVVWEVGITEDGEKKPLGPFFQSDIYKLLRSLSDVLTPEELLKASEHFLNSLEQEKESLEEVGEYWSKIKEERDDLRRVLRETKDTLWPSEQETF